MGTPYNGIPSNISYPAASFVTVSTNTSPIQISTTTNHNLTTGDWVDVQGHSGNTNANGLWQVTVLTVATVALVGSVGTAAGSGGTMQSLAEGATATIPADGDANAAATFTPGTSCALDRTARLNVATGAYKLVAQVSDLVNSDTNTTWAQQISITNAWVQSNAPRLLVVPGATNGDLIDVSMDITGGGTGINGATQIFFGILYATQVPGGSISGFTKIGGSNKSVIPSATNDLYPMTLHASVGVGALGGAAFSFCLGFFALGGTGTSMFASGDYYATARIYRPTGVPQ